MSADDRVNGADFERTIRDDTVRRVVAILRDNLMVNHPRGLNWLATSGELYDLRSLRERLHPGKEPVRG